MLKCEMVIFFFRYFYLRKKREFNLTAEEMDDADNELREVICKLWPNLARRPIKLHEGGTKQLLDLVVPPKTGN
jgi:hypothetical protein